MLQLNKARRDGCNVALLVRKGDPSSALWVFQLWVGVDACVANSPVQSVHDHCQLDRLEWAGYAPNKDSLARVEGQGGVQHKVSVAQLPWSYLHRFVLDGGRADAKVEFVLVLYALFYQGLDGTFVLEEKKRIAFRREVALAFSLMRPVYNEGSKTAE